MLAAARAAWGAKAPRGPIGVEADAVLDPPSSPPPCRAVLTFSSGVDSSYSLVWRTGKAAPQGEPPLGGAVLSQGFDIPLERNDAIEAMRRRLEPWLARRGVQLHVVRTNARDDTLADWEVAAMPTITSALAQVSHLYGYGLLGGSRRYPEQALPLIQSPLLDRLGSGDWFVTATDAASVSRADKVAAIARDAEAVAQLRVCYKQTDRFDRNCCRCAKCRRTMLNFLGVGIATPACFPEMLPPEALAEMDLPSLDEVRYAAEVLAFAVRVGTDGPWATRLAERVAAWQPPPPPPPPSLLDWAGEKAWLWSGRLAADPAGTLRHAVERIGVRVRMGQLRD